MAPIMYLFLSREFIHRMTLFTVFTGRVAAKTKQTWLFTLNTEINVFLEGKRL